MNNIECETCIKRKTIYCPNSGECYGTENKPFYQNRIMLLKENKELHNKIDKLEDKIKQMDNRFKNGLCIDNYLGGRKTRKLFEEMYEILKDSDVDE